jgi:hypothetical protein
MRTFPETSSTATTLSDEPISPGDLAYERERLRNLVHESVLKRFLEASKRPEVSRAIMARRLGKRPEQITRWLGAPGNWTIDTICDLMIAMDMDPADLINQSSAGLSRSTPELVEEMRVRDAIELLTDVAPGSPASLLRPAKKPA